MYFLKYKSKIYEGLRIVKPMYENIRRFKKVLTNPLLLTYESVIIFTFLCLFIWICPIENGNDFNDNLIFYTFAG